jgi:hypothetical protein
MASPADRFVMLFCCLGDKSISKFKYKVVATFTAPLFLAGCGFPVGVQVASLIADGISFVTTDKTLTDHGLSLVTDRDCAVWRSIKGKDICQDGEDQSGEILVSELPEIEPTVAENEQQQTQSASVASAQNSSDDVSFDDFDDQVVSMGRTPDSEDGFTVSARAKLVEKQILQANPDRTNSGHGGTYYIIASYYRAADAERFANKQTKLKTRILSGTAKGKSVYRVAVGPVTDRQSTKNQLLKSGYHDAWALKQENPTVIIEIASLE